LPRLVVDDDVVDGVALRRRVLGVAADVEVEPGAVLEEDVAGAAPRDHAAEQVARDLVRAETALAAQRAGDAVLVLEAEDAALHRASVGVGYDVHSYTSLRGPDDQADQRARDVPGACARGPALRRGIRRRAARRAGRPVRLDGRRPR